MAKYFTQKELDGSISVDGNRGTIEIKCHPGSTLISVPGGSGIQILDAHFNSDGALVVRTDTGTNNGYNQQTHFFLGRNVVYTEYNHSCSQPASRQSDYNREVQAAQNERNGVQPSRNETNISNKKKGGLSEKISNGIDNLWSMLIKFAIWFVVLLIAATIYYFAGNPDLEYIDLLIASAVVALIFATPILKWIWRMIFPKK